jgi:hypothetical protein
MPTPLPAFTPLEDSLWLTLCCRALDDRRLQAMSTSWSRKGTIVLHFRF